MKMSLNHLIDELVVALGISPEAAARHLGERGPDAVGDPVVLPQPDGVQGQQAQLFVRPDVAREEAADVTLPGVPAVIIY